MVALSKEPNLHFVRTTLAARCTGKCFEFDEARSGRTASRKWPSFPFQISTNRVRDRLSGIAIVEIFQPPVDPQTKENGNGKKGKGGDDILLIYYERVLPFQLAVLSQSIRGIFWLNNESSRELKSTARLRF